MTRHLLSKALLPLLSVFFAAAAAVADEGVAASFTSPRDAITVGWPTQYIQMQLPGALAQKALLLLKKRDGDYPTVNMIRVPGTFDAAKPEQAVLDSYHAVGITDASVAAQVTRVQQGWPIITVDYH